MAVITLGLGAAPGYLGGDSEADILEVYQRYQLYQALTEEGPGGGELECREPCPAGAHCAWGLCFCDSGITRIESEEIIFLQPSINMNLYIAMHCTTIK